MVAPGMMMQQPVQMPLQPQVQLSPVQQSLQMLGVPGLPLMQPQMFMPPGMLPLQPAQAQMIAAAQGLPGTTVQAVGTSPVFDASTAFAQAGSSIYSLENIPAMGAHSGFSAPGVSPATGSINDAVISPGFLAMPGTAPAGSLQTNPYRDAGDSVGYAPY